MSVLGVFVVVGMLFVSSAYAAPNDDNTRPGWGFGDDNHIHIGPPGLSVTPPDVKGENERIHNLIMAFLDQLRHELEGFFGPQT